MDRLRTAAGGRQGVELAVQADGQIDVVRPAHDPFGGIIGQVPADDAVAVATHVHVGGEDEVAERRDAAHLVGVVGAPAGGAGHVGPLLPVVDGAAQERYGLGPVINVSPGIDGAVDDQIPCGRVPTVGVGITSDDSRSPVGL